MRKRAERRHPATLKARTSGKNAGRRILLVILSMMLVFSVISPMVAFAEGTEGFEEPFLTGRKDVMDGEESYVPNQNEWPYTESGMSQIGFDSLYGTTRNLITYLGEVSYNLREEFPYRYFPGTEIDGQTRQWSVESGDVDDSSKDPHIWAMTQKNDGILNKILYFVLFLVNLLSQGVDLLLSLFTLACNIDWQSVLDLLGANQLSFVLSRLFVIDVENGYVSPLMVLALLCFFIQLCRVAMSFFKGQGALKPVLGEAAILLGSMLVASIFFGSHAMTVSQIGLNVTTALSNELTQAAIGNDSKIFEYKGGDSATMIARRTQTGLISKLYIDAIIDAQFGYPVSELYIVKPDGSEGGFGDQETVLEVLKETFGSDATINEMAVSTSTDFSSAYVNNLGYYFYAANSTTAVSNGSGDEVWDIEDGKLQVNRGSNSRSLFAIDFLANLREHAVADGDDYMVNKVDTIVGKLVNPDYGAAMANIFMVILVKIFLGIGLLKIVLFSLVGQVIIVFGSLAMVVLPPMMLFPGTRDLAKKMMWTYLIAFVRYLLGTALINGLIVVVVALASGGLAGQLLAIMVSVLMWKFGPMVVLEINLWVSRMNGGREFPQANRFFMRAIGSKHERDRLVAEARRRARNLKAAFSKPSTGLPPSTSGQGSGSGTGGQTSGTGPANGNSQGGAPQVGTGGASWQQAFGSTTQSGGGTNDDDDEGGSHADTGKNDENTPEVDNEDGGQAVVGSGQEETSVNESGPSSANVGHTIEDVPDSDNPDMVSEEEDDEENDEHHGHAGDKNEHLVDNEDETGTPGAHGGGKVEHEDPVDVEGPDNLELGVAATAATIVAGASDEPQDGGMKQVKQSVQKDAQALSQQEEGVSTQEEPEPVAEKPLKKAQPEKTQDEIPLHGAPQEKPILEKEIPGAKRKTDTDVKQAVDKKMDVGGKKETPHTVEKTDDRKEQQQIPDPTQKRQQPGKLKQNEVAKPEAQQEIPQEKPIAEKTIPGAKQRHKKEPATKKQVVPQQETGQKKRARTAPGTTKSVVNRDASEGGEVKIVGEEQPVKQGKGLKLGKNSSKSEQNVERSDGGKSESITDLLNMGADNDDE